MIAILDHEQLFPQVSTKQLKTIYRINCTRIIEENIGATAFNLFWFCLIGQLKCFSFYKHIRVFSIIKIKSYTTWNRKKVIGSMQIPVSRRRLPSYYAYRCLWIIHWWKYCYILFLIRLILCMFWWHLIYLFQCLCIKLEFDTILTCVLNKILKYPLNNV